MVKMKADNLYPPGVHLTDILTVKLLEKGFTPIHSAAFSLGTNGFLVCGPPDIGKSLTVVLALKHGYKFLSEDITVTDGRRVFTNPYTFTFLQIHGFEKASIRLAFWKFIYRNFPPLSYWIKPPRILLHQRIREVNIERNAEIKSIFFLDKGKESLKKIGSEEALMKFLSINRNEFSYHKNPLIFAYSYFNPRSKLNICNLMKKRI